MTTPIQTEPVQLLVACLHPDGAPIAEARAALEGAYGSILAESPAWPFDVTRYYEPEMGPGLSRRFWVFPQRIQPDALVHVKHAAAAVEDRFRAERARRVNLDPLYLDDHKIVLASFKGAGHKIYLGLGVWADFHLRFHKGAWSPFEWTFPDFRDGRYFPFFTETRKAFLRTRREIS